MPVRREVCARQHATGPSTGLIRSRHARTRPTRRATARSDRAQRVVGGLGWPPPAPPAKLAPYVCTPPPHRVSRRRTGTGRWTTTGFARHPRPARGCSWRGARRHLWRMPCPRALVVPSADVRSAPASDHFEPRAGCRASREPPAIARTRRSRRATRRRSGSRASQKPRGASPWRAPRARSAVDHWAFESGSRHQLAATPSMHHDRGRRAAARHAHGRDPFTFRSAPFSSFATPTAVDEH